MKLIAEKLSKADKCDRLRFVRSDGSVSVCPMPRQGILPHDLLHYVVESALRSSRAFLGQIASGAEPAFAMQAGHDRSGPTSEVEAIQAEAVVEALQAQLWSGAFDADAFLEGVGGACSARGLASPDLSHVDPAAMFARAQQLAQQWADVPHYQTFTLQFPGSPI